MGKKVFSCLIFGEWVKIVYSPTRSESGVKVKDSRVAKFAARGEAECSNCNEGILCFHDLVGEDI